MNNDNKISKLDYLQLSTPYSELECIKEGYKPLDYPIKFYKRGYIDLLGVRYFFGNPKTNNANLIYSGLALDNIRVVNWNTRDIIGGMIERGAKITRTDWAITEGYAEKASFTVMDIATDYASGNFTGTLAGDTGKLIVGFDTKQLDNPSIGAETFYIGDMERRGKRGIFRAYDKGTELGGYARDILTRIELEERKGNAHNSAKRYADNMPIGDIINSRIRSSSEYWTRLTGGNVPEIQRGKQLQPATDESEKLDRRKRWLLQQVAPALASVIASDEDFADLFSFEVDRHLKLLT